MRYFKPAAFLLLIMSSAVSLLPKEAIAADDAEATSSASSVSQQSPADFSTLLYGVLNGVLNGGVLNGAPNGAQGEPNNALSIQTPPAAAPSFSDAAPGSTASADEQQMASKSMDLEDFRRMIETPRSEPDSAVTQVPVQTPTQAPESPPPQDLPSLETPDLDEPELEEPTDSEIPVDVSPVEPVGAPPADTQEDSDLPTPTADLNEVPDILFTDPNPLNVPVFESEVDVDLNPVVTLEEAVELAYRNNQTLQASLLSLEQAEAAVREARAALVPIISTSAQLDDTQSGSAGSTTLQGSVRVDYNLITGGSRSASIRAAELQQQVSALTVEVQQEQIRLTTATAYYALQEAGEQIRINQSFVNEAERNLRDSELRQEVGVGTRFDVLRADVQLANALQSLTQSRFDQDIARRDIARLLNLPPTAGLTATPVAKAEIWPLDLEQSILLAFQNRAELEQQLLQAGINEEQRKIALATIRPQVGLFASYGLQTTLASDNSLVDTGELDDSTAFGATFSWRLFDGGATRSAARQQEIQSEISEEQFSESLDQVRFDVEQSFFNLQANEENISTSQVAVSQAEEALSLANLRLQAGVGTQLDVLTAQSELTQAQVNNVTAILGYNRALAALQRAVSNTIRDIL